VTIPTDGVTMKSIAFSPDSRRLLGGSMDYDMQNRGLPAKAKVWDVETGQELLDLEGHVEPIFSVAYSPDGKRILTGTGDMFNPNNPSLVRVWDATTGLEMLSLKGFNDNVLCVTFSPDGRRILAGGGDTQYFDKEGQVILWDVVREQDMIILGGHSDLVRRVSFSEDGEYVYGEGKDNKVTVWSIRQRKSVKKPGPIQASFSDQAESPDGKYTAVMQGESVVLLDNALYKQQNRWPLPDSRERKKYHETEAKKFEQEKNGFAAAFHLGRLLKLDPDNAALRNRLRQAEAMPMTASSPPTR
ncbi:MAG: WD40 repeat domain-containing protein, partial [Gemmataceae bacterium]